MKTKKMLLLWCLFILPLFLAACGDSTQTPSSLPTISAEEIKENTYIYYYGQTCGHCKNVEKYLKTNEIDQQITITPKEVQMNKSNQQELLNEAERLWVPLNQVGTPFMVVQRADGTETTLIGEDEIYQHFETLEKST
jgi:glutaredoxin